VFSLSPFSLDYAGPLSFFFLFLIYLSFSEFEINQFSFLIYFILYKPRMYYFSIIFGDLY